MAKKTKDEQQQVAAEVSSNESKKVGGEAAESKVEATEKKQPLYIETTEGKRLDRIDVYNQDETTMVKASYGTLSEGKTSKDIRKNMRALFPRALTPEQSAEYQKLASQDPKKALEFAARAAFPMHVDDKKFNNKVGVIGDKEVDYIFVKKLTENDVTPEFKHLIDKWQLSAGKSQGGSGAHMKVMLDDETHAMIRHRGEVTLGKPNDKGWRDVIAVGKPMTLLEIANDIFVERDKRLAHDAELIEKAKSIDLSKYKLPEGITITGAYFRKSTNPDRVWLNGRINSIRVNEELTVNESTLVTKMKAPLDIMFVVNKNLAKEVNSILAQAKAQEQSAGMHR